MTAVRPSPDDTLEELLPRDHLPGCPHRRRGPRGAALSGVDARNCEWCTCSWITPTTRLLARVQRDAQALLGVEQPGVPWIVAWRRLFEVREEAAAALPGHGGDGYAEPASRLLREVDDALERGRRSLGAGPGSELSSACAETAAALALCGCAPAEERHRLDPLPRSLRADVGRILDQLPDQLSAGAQVATLLPVVDLRLERPVPPLRTQPEWQRRPSPERDPLGSTRVAAGSLEALVLERLLIERTEQMIMFASRLVDDPAPLPMQRAVIHPSATVRSLTWRVTSVDWHATWIDAAGVGDTAEVSHDENDVGGMGGVTEVVQVPWFVAVAVDLAAEQGRRSLLAPAEMGRR